MLICGGGDGSERKWKFVTKQWLIGLGIMRYHSRLFYGIKKKYGCSLFYQKTEKEKKEEYMFWI